MLRDSSFTGRKSVNHICLFLSAPRLSLMFLVLFSFLSLATDLWCGGVLSLARDSLQWQHASTPMALLNGESKLNIDVFLVKVCHSLGLLGKPENIRDCKKVRENDKNVGAISLNHHHMLSRISLTFWLTSAWKLFQPFCISPDVREFPWNLLGESKKCQGIYFSEFWSNPAFILKSIFL